jgi:hypothetical protein
MSDTIQMVVLCDLLKGFYNGLILL